MPEPKALHILWTNDNLDTSRLMVMTYSTNSMANRLWDSITVIAWGAPVKLLAEDETIQEHMKMAAHVGVRFTACATCARQLGVTEKLEALGVEALPWVEPFTNLVQSGAKIIYV